MLQMIDVIEANSNSGDRNDIMKDLQPNYDACDSVVADVDVVSRAIDRGRKPDR